MDPLEKIECARALLAFNNRLEALKYLEGIAIPDRESIYYLILINILQSLIDEPSEALIALHDHSKLNIFINLILHINYERCLLQINKEINDIIDNQQLDLQQRIQRQQPKEDLRKILLDDIELSKQTLPPNFQGSAIFIKLKALTTYRELFVSTEEGKSLKPYLLRM